MAFNRVAHERSRKGNYYYYEESEVKNRRTKASTGDSSQNSASRNAAVGVVQRPMVVDYTWRIERTDCAE